MSRADISAAVLQIGGLALAPLLVGFIQQVKAKLQGRRGPSPLQPYRDLRRLWRKTVVDVERSTAVYRLAPAVIAACAATAVLLVPVGGRSLGWPLGNDAIVLVGVLALARAAAATAAWDTGSGFALMGSSRDLTFSVFVEPLLLIVFAVGALAAGTTDLREMSDAASGTAIWGTAAHWCAGLAFIIAVLAETGRQPIDNPDTHLELTMVHEGPLLEYAGRDLAFLHWAGAARHWIMLVLCAELFVPHPASFELRLVVLALALPLLCVGLAVIETWQAKLAVLRAPRLLLAGALLAFIGFVSAYIGSLS
ncbi:MAG: respiratory chain complex I subunit 1 family protein [Gaiellaceae bacterium]